ncbi:MAG: LysR family transcriptional regulator [Burkholderiales bacterium PBB5]|nr:MAG: LysR family transcriptional regulator [Burkholderiales bacterium PBB5]
MKRISIKPVWTIQDSDGPALPTRLLDLLVQVQAQGSLLAACQQLGLSYRHAWDLVRQGEAVFGTTLLHMERGKGSTLTALGEKLVWADHRIHARLRPVLESLASELATEIAQVSARQPAVLRLQASHGFAIERLVERLAQAGLAVEHKYGSSTAAAAALHDGACDLAGLHVPLGPLQDAALAHYGRWLQADDLVLIDMATRRQGLMLAPGNPRKVYELADLLRPEVRFINRQAGSGTRQLLEGLLKQAGLATSRIAGYEQGEFTHAAVAAFVASGMADVGFGLETPARQFKLDFVPLANERYFLVCKAQALQLPIMDTVLATLRSESFATAVNALPGYRAVDAGQITPMRQAFPSAPRID